MVGGERQLSAGPYGLGAVWSPWSREHEIPPERSASVGVTRLDVEGPALQAQCHLEPRPSRLSHVLEVHPRRSGSDHAVDIVAQIGSECSEGGGEAAEWRPADARLERSRADGTKRGQGRVRREAGLQADAGSRRVGAGQLEKCRRAKARRPRAGDEPVRSDGPTDARGWDPCREDGISCRVPRRIGRGVGDVVGDPVEAQRSGRCQSTERSVDDPRLFLDESA